MLKVYLEFRWTQNVNFFVAHFSLLGAFARLECVLRQLILTLTCFIMASVYRSKSNQGLERKGQNDAYYGQLRAKRREDNKVERNQNEASGNMSLFSGKYRTSF